MEINRIEGQTYREKTGETKARHEKKGSFYENLSENLSGQTEKNADIKAASNTTANRTAGAVANKSYHYRNISAAVLSKTGTIGEGIEACAVKNISYQESDYVKTFAQSGFTLMAQVDVSARSVYIEQRIEDGTIRGYHVEIDKLNKNGNDLIGQSAIKAWENVRAKEEAGEADDENLTVEEALQRFYEFVEDRIKNGPPKYLIGNSEFSVEEWDKFLKSIDGQLDDIKEETEEMIERLKQQAEEKEENQEALLNELFQDNVRKERE